MQLQQTFSILSQGSPNSREALLRYCKKTLGSNLLETIDSHNTASVILIFRQDRGKYVLKAEYGQDNATSKEVTWYETLKGRTASVAPKCLYALTKDQFSFLILDYLENARTLEDIMLTNNDTANVLHYVDEALEKNQELYLSSQPKELSLTVMDEHFAGKFNQRVRESSSYPYLMSLYDAESIVVNGFAKMSPIRYMKRITANPTLHAYLTPGQAGLIHGDLHLGNVLVSQNRAYLVDPNGSLLMPIEYDYGKLLHSVNGLYGQIMRGDYTLREVDKHKFEFSVRADQTYDSVFMHLKKRLTDHDMLRGLYAEALHFSTMLPHHATNRQETTALFLRSVELFDELFGYLGEKVI